MIESAFEKFVEKKWKDAMNIMVTDTAGWGSAMLEQKKMTPPAKVFSVKATYSSAEASTSPATLICRVLGVHGMRPPPPTGVASSETQPLRRERRSKRTTTSAALRHRADQDCFGRRTDLKPDECTGKHAKWLHDLMTKRAASVNTACCMYMEEEDNRCVNVIQCDRKDNVVDGVEGTWCTLVVYGRG
jgi:hypothetical protein